MSNEERIISPDTTHQQPDSQDQVLDDTKVDYQEEVAKAIKLLLANAQRIQDLLTSGVRFDVTAVPMINRASDLLEQAYRVLKDAEYPKRTNNGH